MIQVKGVTKIFDSFKALDDISLTVPSGSIYGLVGPNGAGKSTLIRHITGIYKPNAGEVLIDGYPIWENPVLKSRIAYISDDVYSFVSADIRRMKKFYQGIYPDFNQERYEKLKEVFNIDEKRTIRRLSKGMQKQVAFWLALCCMPDIMVLDEPVDGLDPVMRRQVWSLVISDVAERGTTVLISSHNLRELEDVCDHVGIMDKGRLLLQRSLSELQENIVKVQLALKDDCTLPGELDIVHRSDSGRIMTLIIRGSSEKITNQLSALAPLFLDVIPLTLEEIFIYELGGADYAVKDIVL